MDAFTKREYAMHVGHFLVDRSGVVRWTWVESPSTEDISQYGRFPTDDEILAAVRSAGVLNCQGPPVPGGPGNGEGRKPTSCRRYPRSMQYVSRAV